MFSYRIIESINLFLIPLQIVSGFDVYPAWPAERANNKYRERYVCLVVGFSFPLKAPRVFWAIFPERRKTVQNNLERMMLCLVIDNRKIKEFIDGNI